MTNREKFRSIFGVYAEEFWSYPKDKMLDWLQYDVPDTNVGDMISRQAAIDAMEQAKEQYFDRRVIIGKMQDIVNNLPSAESRWIPVTEGLPEDGAEVWVTTEMLSEVTRARWHKDTNLWYHPYNADCLLVLRPIAWMPMNVPEPWKGGAE